MKFNLEKYHDELCDVTPAFKKGECGTNCCTVDPRRYDEEQRDTFAEALKVIAWLAMLILVGLLMCGKDK